MSSRENENTKVNTAEIQRQLRNRKNDEFFRKFQKELLQMLITIIQAHKRLLSTEGI